MILVGEPTKGYKTKTLVICMRKPRSKWYWLACFGPKGHYRKDGSCEHTDAFLENVREELRPRVKLDGFGGKG